MVVRQLVNILLALVLMYVHVNALAFTEVENYKITTPQSRLQEATRQGLGISYREMRAKREILEWKRNQPEKYSNLQIAPNRYVTEIQEGLSKVEPAKALAKLYLMKHINNNWSRLRQTVFIDTPSDSWGEAQRYIKAELEKITLVQTVSKSYYRFEVPWGYALVQRNLSEVKTAVQVAAHLNGNKLPEGAENIHIETKR